MLAPHTLRVVVVVAPLFAVQLAALACTEDPAPAPPVAAAPVRVDVSKPDTPEVVAMPAVDVVAPAPQASDAAPAVDDRGACDDDSVACLEEKVAAQPQDKAVRAALVKRALDARDGAKARVYAEELVRQAPLDPQARQMLGRAYMQQKMWHEAIDAFKLVVDVEPDNVFAHNNIGYSALQLGELDLAREHLERCLGLQPQKGFMLNNLGVVYERLGRTAEAHAAYSRATELSPSYLQARLNRDRIQKKLSADERVASLDALAHLRAPPPAGSPEAVVAPAADPRAVKAAVDAVSGITAVVPGAGAAAAGGSPRLAPEPAHF